MAYIPHTILGSALSLLLVFRTNSSYGRLVEGRRVRMRSCSHPCIPHPLCMTSLMALLPSF
jgi:hypothetical protein